MGLSVGLFQGGGVACASGCYCHRQLAWCALTNSVFQCLLPGLGGGQVKWFHPPPPPWLGLHYLDLPEPALCEGPLQLPFPPSPESWLLSVRLRPEQPLRALGRMGATASISLLNYAAAVVGRSTLSDQLRRGAGMGGASGVGIGWEERMGVMSRSCWAPGPQSKPLPSCGLLAGAVSQALAQ